MTENGLVNKKWIMEVWVFLREKNHSIPNETLDFMRDVSLKQLQNTSSNSDYATALKVWDEFGEKADGMLDSQFGYWVTQRLNQRS